MAIENVRKYVSVDGGMTDNIRPALYEAKYDIIGVVTNIDKPKGRGKTLMPTPVKEEAMKYDIPVYQPLKVRDPEFVEILENIAPDIIVVAAFGQIIPKSILDNVPDYSCIFPTGIG